jgi:energy-coupling factor transporter ATP-binding protein EcfA2
MFKETLEADANGTFAIYAANGTMKTSLSRTFKALASGTLPSDEMYPDRQSKCEIVNEADVPLDPAQIVVVPPYAESFERSSRVSTLLVNPELRDKYQCIEEDLAEKTQEFLKAMKSSCGKRDGVDAEISTVFMGKPDALLDAVRRIRQEVNESDDAPFSDVPYGDLFNDKIAALMGDAEIQKLLGEYIERLNALLDESPFFSRETFSYYGAEQVASALEKHGFFDAQHAVELRTGTDDGGGRRRIETKDELAQLVQAEKDRIAEDSGLRTKYAAIGKKLEANEAVRKFKACLDRHPEIIPLLNNYGALRQEVWKSYFVENKNVFEALAAAYESARDERNAIHEQAKKEKTRWEYVIDLFNKRFSVPFRLRAKNHVDLVLGRVDAMELVFQFQDQDGQAVPVERDRLIATLSQGERRAIYLLDVLFEVEARRRANEPTLFVFDDVADSFDYKNKYAIVRYLEDIKEWPGSRLIILTHNFDFLRSVHGSVVARSKCQIAVKGSQGISLHPIDGVNNIFMNDLKGRFFDDPLRRLASIPFMRNLVEYLAGKDDQRYERLTALLHWKSDTPKIKNKDLDELYEGLFSDAQQWHDGDSSVWNLMIATADNCLGASEGMNFPNKVVLAMACRLLADKHMLEVLADGVDSSEISNNQTRQLFKTFQKTYGTEHASYDSLHRTVLITPEHLHLNAFMYEPIIDVSDTELRTLYRELRALTPSE